MQTDLPTTLAVIESLPFPIMLCDCDGTVMAVNEPCEQLWCSTREALVGILNVLDDAHSLVQGGRPYFARVLAGECVETLPERFDPEQSLRDICRKPLWLQVTMCPVCDGKEPIRHVILHHRDVTHEMEQEQALATQSLNITTLFNPVLNVWDGVLAVPLVGLLDVRRADRIIATILKAASHAQAQCVILDVTGVSIIDTAVAHHLIQAAQALSFLGAKVALVGIRPEIAQTLVMLNVTLRHVTILADLQSAIDWALTYQGLAIVRKG